MFDLHTLFTRSPFITLLFQRAQSGRRGDPVSGNECGSPNHIYF